MAYLRSLDDQTQIPIEEGENLLVGRLPKCDVVIQDASVSSQHARLHLFEGILQVVDMDSTNGTRVNYALLTKPSVLMDGDTLEFGNVCFTIDGPELRADAKPNRASILEPDRKTLEASQRIDATMSISLPEDFERIEDAAPPPPEPEALIADSTTAENETQSEPVLLILLMLLLAGGLLVAQLWTWTP